MLVESLNLIKGPTFKKKHIHLCTYFNFKFEKDVYILRYMLGTRHSEDPLLVPLAPSTANPHIVKILIIVKQWATCFGHLPMLQPST